MDHTSIDLSYKAVK